MSIDIVVEDGTGLTNANAYVSVADARLYASNRGISLSSNDDDVAAQLIMATDYLQQFDAVYKGVRVGIMQALCWPRIGAFVYNNIANQNYVEFPSNQIPTQLIAAQSQLCIEQFNGTILMPTTSGPFITQDTVGPITTKFSEKLSTSQQPDMPTVNILLRALLEIGGPPLRNVRA